MQKNALAEFSFAPLKEFEHAIIYLFHSEASYQHTDMNKIECFLHQVGQYKDMFDAYLYAQDTVLFTIRKKGIANISESQLLQWLNDLHLRIAGTLAKDGTDKVAGAYSKDQLIRWRYSGLHYFSDYLAGKISWEKFLATMEGGFNIDHFKLFLNLLEKIGKNHLATNEINFYPFAAVKKDNIPIAVGFFQLIPLYHSNLLKQDEKKLISKFIQIVMPPSEYQQAMENYAKDLLTTWRQCTPNDADAAAQLATKSFYLTSIHPYFNGNGRLATCFVNIILRSLNLPSIVLRYPFERDDPNSTYCKAMENIEDTKLLYTHIKQRLSEANVNFSKDKRMADIAKYIEDRISILQIVNVIKVEHPNCDLNNQYGKLIKLCSEKSESTDYEAQNIAIFKKGFMDLYQSLKNSDLSKQMLSSIKYQYTAEEKNKIITILSDLTQSKGWVAYKKNGLTILLTLNDKAQVRQMIGILEKTKALKAVSKINTETGKPVVYVDEINFEELNKFYSANKPAVNLANNFNAP